MSRGKVPDWMRRAGKSAPSAKPKNDVAETQVVITVTEPKPGELGVRVQGPDNVLVLLGIIELAKAHITDPNPIPLPEDDNDLVIASPQAVQHVNGHGS